MSERVSTVWVHRSGDGKVAWGAAVLVAPVVPFLCFLTLLIVLGIGRQTDVETGLVLAPVPWLLAGGGLSCVAGRVVRGIGLGLVGGALASLVLALAAAHGGWR